LPVWAQQAAQKTTLSAGDIYKRASPAVVLIEIYNSKGEVSGAGSGFLVTADGEIVTNFHVIAHTKRATVRLANQDAYDTVEVIDVDKRKDVAILKIKAVGLPFLTLGQSDSVEVGQTVYSLSNPLGALDLQNTLSQGILSGIRQGDGYHYFQISAPISHGSSGGPIFNSYGEVIGIAVASLEEGQNLNFAVPINYAKGMISSAQPLPLESVYEPEPEKEGPPATPAGSGPPPAPPGSSASALRPQPSDEMKKGSLVYVASKIAKWSDRDATRELGTPVRHRFGYDSRGTATTDIYAYPDPTNYLRELELAFDVKSNILVDVYGYPWDMTWDQCKMLWGDDAKLVKKPDGTYFRLYRNRHLNVYLDKSDKVISLGIY
jgi:V8-like Glu-specific endopeptidase